MLADPELTIELVAAEPEVASPVAIAWDEEGRLFVAEMLDYPIAPTSGRIRRLEDRDGDGRYERATVFADGLPFPERRPAVLRRRARDRGAEHLVLARHATATAAPRSGGSCSPASARGTRSSGSTACTWGLDNWIYVANGRSDGEVRTPDRSARPGRLDPPPRRAVPALPAAGPGHRADRLEVEPIAGFSQFGLPHDDWGNRFPSWNTIPIRHVVLEQQTLDRNPYLAETSSVASILDMADGGRIFPISPPQPRFNRESVAYFNASCGPTDRARRPACRPPITATPSSASRWRTWCIAACSSRPA